ncbi:unnamed protein product [[Candida] boidinii]|nr:unnamed protein product [[Candida] boidinii]
MQVLTLAPSVQGCGEETIKARKANQGEERQGGQGRQGELKHFWGGREREGRQGKGGEPATVNCDTGVCVYFDKMQARYLWSCGMVSLRRTAKYARRSLISDSSASAHPGKEYSKQEANKRQAPKGPLNGGKPNEAVGQSA